MDKLQEAVMIASGAIANDEEVFMFCMQDAVYALKKDAPGEPEVHSPYQEVVEKIKKAKSENKIIHWKSLLEDLKELGELKVVVCSQIVEILGLSSKNDFDPIVDEIAGVATLSKVAMEADQVISL
ncbi:MAG: DsrE family protein [Candidatus Hodarchaeales archaeon]